VNIGGANYETLESWHTDSYGPPMDGTLYVNPFVIDPTAAPTTFALLPQPENNVRDFWNTGVVTNNSVALSGGTEKSSARLSISNTTINGITPKHRENHQSINLRATTNITSKLSFDAKVNYMHKNADNVPTLGSSTENYVYDLAILGRFVPLGFLKQYYDQTHTRGSFPNVAYNPYYLMNEIKNNGVRDRIVSFVSAKYQFNDWLSLMARSGIDVYSDRRRQFWPVGARYPNAEGRVIDEEYFTKESNSDVLLSAVKNNFFKNFSGSLSIGASITRRNYRSQSWDAQSFKIPGIYDVSNAKTVYPNFSNIKRENQSVYVSGQVGYKNFLFLDLTGRNDWSSTLGQKYYSFFYPSVTGSFVFTDALSIYPSVLSFGKLRASYAEAGNDASPYLTQSGFQFNSASYNGQNSAYASNTISLFDLKNELKKSTEVGIDLRFFQDRITLDATYYKSNTINQIVPVQISSGSGYTTKVVNAGNIENKGIELSLNLNPIRTRSSFRWDITFNYSRNQSKVKELAPGVETYLLYTSYPSNIEARVGQAFGNIVGYGYKRAPDGQIVVGTDGGYMRDDTVRILGNVTPKWIGGLSNTFSYKGFSLSALVDFVQGNQITSSTKYQMVAKGIGAFTTKYREHSEPLPGVIEVDNGSGGKTYEKNTILVDGQTAWAGRAWGDRSEEFVLNGSFIMLREVLLGYTFRPTFIKKTPFTSFRLSLVGRNLWYIEQHMQDMGISPETNLNPSAGATGVEAMSMPTTRSYGFTLNFTF
jgi:TonB-linked SusC/RagA family outer membrane protein